MTLQALIKVKRDRQQREQVSKSVPESPEPSEEERVRKSCSLLTTFLEVQNQLRGVTSCGSLCRVQMGKKAKPKHKLTLLRWDLLHAETGDEDEPRGAEKREMDVNQADLSQPGVSDPKGKKKKNCFHVHLVNFDWLHFTGSHLALFSTHFPITLHWGEWEHGRNTLDHSLRSKTAWEPFFSSLTEWGNYFHLACSEFTRQSVIASVAVILQAEQPPPGQSVQQERE